MRPRKGSRAAPPIASVRLRFAYMALKVSCLGPRLFGHAARAHYEIAFIEGTSDCRRNGLDTAVRSRAVFHLRGLGGLARPQILLVRRGLERLRVVSLRLRKQEWKGMGRSQGLAGRGTNASWQRRLVRAAATGASGGRTQYRERTLRRAVARRRGGRIACRRIIEAVRLCP